MAVTIDELIQKYSMGAQALSDVVLSVSAEKFDLTPQPGKWSIRQVVCHLADFEPIYADRMKRVLVEENPTLFGGDPDVFAGGLHYDKRDVREELELIRIVRSQMVRILKAMDLEDFQRTGVHSEAGPLTLETLLERITGHIPHHLKFIEEKIRLM